MQKINEEFVDHINYFNEIMANRIVVSKKLQKKFLDNTKDREIIKKATGNYPWINNHFYTYVFRKIDNIKTKLVNYNDELGFYCLHYKRMYDINSVIILVLSSCITLVEGISLCFEPVIYTNIIVLLLGTLVSVITAVLKFYNFKGKTEEIVKLCEKINVCEAKFFLLDKKLKSRLFIEYEENSNSVDEGDQLPDSESDRARTPDEVHPEGV